MGAVAVFRCCTPLVNSSCLRGDFEVDYAIIVTVRSESETVDIPTVHVVFPTEVGTELVGDAVFVEHVIRRAGNISEKIFPFRKGRNVPAIGACTLMFIFNDIERNQPNVFVNIHGTVPRIVTAIFGAVRDFVEAPAIDAIIVQVLGEPVLSTNLDGFVSLAVAGIDNGTESKVAVDHGGDNSLCRILAGVSAIPLGTIAFECHLFAVNENLGTGTFCVTFDGVQFRYGICPGRNAVFIGGRFHFDSTGGNKACHYDSGQLYIAWVDFHGCSPFESKKF